MSAQRIAAIVLRQFYLMRGSPARVVPLFAWVAIDIVLWGFITRYLDTVSGSGVRFLPMLLGAVLIWDFFTRVMQGITTAFFEDLWSRNFLNIFAAPLSIHEYLAGLVVTSILTSLIGLATMLVVASTAFDLSFAGYGIWLMPCLLNLFLFGIALGIFASALVLRLGPASEWFVWPIPAVLSPFVGVFYPLSTLPDWMQAIARLLPPSYAFESLRAVVAGQAVSVTVVAGSNVLALAYIGLAAWTFSRVHRSAVRSGLIARYSAESVS